MAKVIVPTVLGFVSLMGVWVVYGSIHTVVI